MPRRPDTWVSLRNLMLKLRGISHFAILGSDSPQSQSNNSYRVINSIHPKWYTADSACTDTGAALAPLSNRGTRLRHWQSARRLWPDTRRLQLPLDDCCRPENKIFELKLCFKCLKGKHGASECVGISHQSCVKNVISRIIILHAAWWCCLETRFV